MLGFTSVLVQEGGIGSHTACLAKMVTAPYGKFLIFLKLICMPSFVCMESLVIGMFFFCFGLIFINHVIMFGLVDDL